MDKREKVLNLRTVLNELRDKQDYSSFQDLKEIKRLSGLKKGNRQE